MSKSSPPNDPSPDETLHFGPGEAPVLRPPDERGQTLRLTLPMADGEVRTLRFGALSLGLGMFGVTLAANPWIFALALLFVPTGTALLFPCTTSLVTRYAKQDQVGQTVGVQQAFGGTSRLLAPIWAGIVFEQVGVREPFWIGGTLVLLTALVALRLAPGEAPTPVESPDPTPDPTASA